MLKQSAEVALGGNVVIEVLVSMISSLIENVMSLVATSTVAVKGGGGASSGGILLLLLLFVVVDEDGNANTKVVEMGRLGVWIWVATEGNANE